MYPDKSDTLKRRTEPMNIDMMFSIIALGISLLALIVNICR